MIPCVYLKILRHIGSGTLGPPKQLAPEAVKLIPEMLPTLIIDGVVINSPLFFLSSEKELTGFQNSFFFKVLFLGNGVSKKIAFEIY